MAFNLKRLRKGLTREEYRLRILNILAMDLREIKDFIRDPDQCALDRWIASITINGIQNGDPKRLEYFMNRLIGSVEANVKIEGNINHKSLQQYIEERGEVIKVEPPPQIEANQNE